MQKIWRNKRIEGITIPVFIYNCSHIFFVDLEIYEDGMINCWELVDLPGLREKLAGKWLVTNPQTQKEIDINGLGIYLIGESSWQFDQDSFYEHVVNCLKEINPRLENIYTISEAEKALLEQRQVFHSPQAVPFVVQKELFYETAEGMATDIFYRFEDQIYLVKLVAYDQDHIAIQRLPQEQKVVLSKIEHMFAQGILFSEFSATEWVIIHQLGKVQITGADYVVSATEKLKEVQENCIKSTESAFQRCRTIYIEYLKHPSSELRQILKQYYEAIPEHQRCYLGDMDTKDYDYRRIIYHSDKKRWV